MRILVYPHDLTIGGSQINAIDLAAAVSAAGHEVIVYGVPGPLVSYVAERGLRYLPARSSRYRPALSRVAELAALASRERIDLIHGYEWSSCLDAYFGANLVLGVPLLCSVLSMQVMPFVPASVPLIMGTAELGRAAQRVQRAGVWVIEPPIDVDRDAPHFDGAPFRRSHGVADDELLLVSVSRLALDLKLDALVRLIDAAETLAKRRRLRLVLIGDGPAADALRLRAARVNEALGREVVMLPGAESDPRPAYAAADIVAGMGSSALRALAIGRPLVVQGERGFSETFRPATSDLFLDQGFYGVADDAPGSSLLAAQLEELLDQPELRSELGRFGRRFVVERFSLARAAKLQTEIYEKVAADVPRRRLSDAARSARLAISLEIANHDPRNKRRKRSWESKLLAAAESGLWPPALAR